MTRLTGWQRLGIVLFVGWALGIATIAIYEHANRKDGWFVGLTMPLGTVVSGNIAMLPDGQTVKLNMEGATEPWEIQLDKQSGSLTVQTVHKRSVIGALILPLFLWVALSLLARVAGWVRDGFRARAA